MSEDEKLKVEQERLSVEKLKLAAEYHKLRHAGHVETFKPTLVFATEGLKTLQLCHAGGLGATFAVATALMNRPVGAPDNLQATLLCFGLGLCLTLVAWFFAWLSQSTFSDASGAYSNLPEFPFTEDTSDAERLHRRGNILKGISLAAVVASMILFAVGVFNLRAALN